jgi:hypothetical protein
MSPHDENRYKRSCSFCNYKIAPMPPKLDAVFEVQGDIGILRKKGQTAIFDARFIDDIKKLTWTVDKGSISTSIKVPTGINPVAKAAFPDIGDYFDIKNVKMPYFVYYYLDKKQTIAERKDANKDKTVIVPVNGFSWDARADNLREQDGIRHKPTSLVFFEEPLSSELGLRFQPLLVKVVSEGNTYYFQASCDPGRELISSRSQLVSIKARMDDILGQLRKAFSEIGRDYDAENAAFVRMVESGLPFLQL